MVNRKNRWWAFERGKFRDVEFVVLEFSRDGSRALAMHRTLANRDERTYGDAGRWSGEIEDLGNDVTRFRVRALLVVGTADRAADGQQSAVDPWTDTVVTTKGEWDWRPSAQRLHWTKQSLIRALDEPGPGILLLPTTGEVTVRVERYSTKEDARDPSVVEFEIDFAKEPNTVFEGDQLLGRGDFRSVNTESSSLFLEGVGTEIAAGIESAGPETVRTATSDALSDASAAIARLDVFSGPAAEAARLASRLSGLIMQASSLATAPANLALSVYTALRTVENSVANAFGALEAYEAIARAIGGSGSWLVGTIEHQNFLRASTVFQLAALGGVLRALPDVQWKALEDALEARDRLCALADAIAESGPEDASPALERFRLDVVALVPPAGNSLPSLVAVQVPAMVPAVVLAWNLYQDATRDAELIERNDIPNPMFVDAGSVLQVADA